VLTNTYYPDVTAGGRDKFAVDQVGGKICTVKGGGEYASNCEGTSGSKFGRFRENVKGLHGRQVSVLSIPFPYCVTHYDHLS
jgi:hypothetical protein